MEKPKKPKKPTKRRPVDVSTHKSLSFDLCRDRVTNQIFLLSPQERKNLIRETALELGEDPENADHLLQEVVEFVTDLSSRNLATIIAKCALLDLTDYTLEPECYEGGAYSYEVIASVKRTEEEILAAVSQNSAIQPDYERALAQWELDVEKYGQDLKAWQLEQAQAVVDRLRSS